VADVEASDIVSSQVYRYCMGKSNVFMSKIVRHRLSLIASIVKYKFHCRTSVVQRLQTPDALSGHLLLQHEESFLQACTSTKNVH